MQALQLLEKPFFPAEEEQAAPAEPVNPASAEQQLVVEQEEKEEQASGEAVAAAAVEAVLAPAPAAAPEAEVGARALGSQPLRLAACGGRCLACCSDCVCS